MLVKITGSTLEERQTQLYSLVAEKLENDQKVHMISNRSWQEVIMGMFALPNFNTNKLRALQNDEFTLVAPGNEEECIGDYYHYYDVFVLDSMDSDYLKSISSTILSLESSMHKTLIIN